jgi:hypothetical protein
MLERYAIINKEGFLENIIVLEEGDAMSWEIPEGYTIKKASEFVPPVEESVE